SEIRRLAVDGLAFLGLRLDERRNLKVDGDADLTEAGADANTLVIRAREDLEIARQVRRVMRQAPARG
ncbi:MAG: hypothetical protein JOY58_02535, partial [Solirubrobacterales bacterium]|nr:hypothetical protein [Solirubrobacterales bacterium]